MDIPRRTSNWTYTSPAGFFEPDPRPLSGLGYYIMLTLGVVSFHVPPQPDF